MTKSNKKTPKIFVWSYLENYRKNKKKNFKSSRQSIPIWKLSSIKRGSKL